MPERQYDDAAARVALAALPGPYLPWSTSAMRPAGLVTVLNDIVINDRRRIVELGGGVSSVLIARLLAQRRSSTPGARLAVIEHHADWVGWISDQLEREGLADGVTLVHAPLRSDWYDQAAVSAWLEQSRDGIGIDLLIVDGPPAYEAGRELARHPALPVLAAHLETGATVVLDDVERIGEQEVLRRWERESGLQFERLDSGIAVGRYLG